MKKLYTRQVNIFVLSLCNFFNILPLAFNKEEELTGRENYNTWAFTVKNLLLHEDLWDSVADPQNSKKDDKAKAKIVLPIERNAILAVILLKNR